MCMDKFVKKLYDFRGIYRIFGVKIVIGLSKNHCNLIITIGFDSSQNSRYLLIFTDILPIFTNISPIFNDILPIFFQKFQQMPS